MNTHEDHSQHPSQRTKASCHAMSFLFYHHLPLDHLIYFSFNEANRDYGAGKSLTIYTYQIETLFLKSVVYNYVSMRNGDSS